MGGASQAGKSGKICFPDLRSIVQLYLCAVTGMITGQTMMMAEEGGEVGQSDFSTDKECCQFMPDWAPSRSLRRRRWK